MASLVERLDALQLTDDERRKDLYGYIYRTKKERQYYLCSGDFLVVPSFDGKKFILCQLLRDKEDTFVCYQCEHRTAIENITLSTNNKTKCIHTQLCKILFPDANQTYFSRD